MNTATATKRGDWHLLWCSILRFFAALIVTLRSEEIRFRLSQVIQTRLLE